ncbi:hypothetical protein BKA70DRAFT_1239705 [Coprinopsis sp. MPI-PUGE-AT-0042]|nr:hypothetical protein BKA70DRAFT_1239705 [Coprinopsis sp. MPI-PUGE-AT-0042]
MVPLGLLDVPDELLLYILRCVTRNGIRAVMGLHTRIHGVAVGILYRSLEINDATRSGRLCLLGLTSKHPLSQSMQYCKAIRSFGVKTLSEWGRALINAMLLEVLSCATNIVQLTLRTEPDHSSALVKYLDSKLPGFFRDQPHHSKFIADVWAPRSGPGVRSFWCLPSLRSLCVGREFRFVRLLAHRAVEDLELDYIANTKMLTLFLTSLDLSANNLSLKQLSITLHYSVHIIGALHCIHDSAPHLQSLFIKQLGSPRPTEVEVWKSTIASSWPAMRSLRKLFTRLTAGPIWAFIRNQRRRVVPPTKRQAVEFIAAI